MEPLSIIMSMIGGREILMIFIVLLIFLFPLVALIDILTHSFKGNDKIVWVLVVILLPLLGAGLYLSIGRFQKIKETEHE